MFHTHNKSEDELTTSNPTAEPTISQSSPYPTPTGVIQGPPLPTNMILVTFQQRDLNVNLPNGIVPTGYTWSVVYGLNFYKLEVSTGSTASTPIFTAWFPIGLQRPKDCIIQCIVTYSGGSYTIPYVIRWRTEMQDIVATITNGSNSYSVNGSNSVLTQQPTIQIVGSTITAWSWSVVINASWSSYTASSISITNGTTATPTFISTTPTNELPGYYVISCNISYLSPTNYAVTNLVYSIVQVY